MKPEIERYLREYGDRYTTEALRRQLLDAGHGPVDVDNALREWEARKVTGRSPEAERRRYMWWAVGLHVLALVLIAIWLIPTGAYAFGAAWTILIILAVLLLIGWGISSAIGRAMLPASGLVVALIVPAASALLIGGTCLGILGGLVVP
jgi:hypothetical protein